MVIYLVILSKLAEPFLVFGLKEKKNDSLPFTFGRGALKRGDAHVNSCLFSWEHFTPGSNMHLRNLEHVNPSK